MNRRVSTAAGLMLLIVAQAEARPLHPERYYQEAWCAEQGGQAEVQLADGSRVDCLTSTHAVEVDFAPKWAESIGQSLHYARLTGLRPGVLLIQGSDGRHRRRLQPLADDLGITIWVIPQ